VEGPCPVGPVDAGRKPKWLAIMKPPPLAGNDEAGARHLTDDLGPLIITHVHKCGGCLTTQVEGGHTTTRVMSK
jgi:hypothetical protein